MTIVPDLDDVERRVIDIVAETLSHPRETVTRYCSLIDDLGAESIDFIDIVFRVESEFDLLIPNEELWAGSIDVKGSDPEAIARGVARLRETMPDFHWERFRDGVSSKDLPRLITINTIAEYVRKQIATGAA